ncbi:MAG: hypothetical protein KJ714_05645 [Euryarchaeota archaeon]|nr:hypothetical protein [Euryarchaeota archaeon]
MMKRDHRFVNVCDPETLGRLARSFDIRVLNRFEHFEAVNSKNGHVYKVRIAGEDIVCTCKDSGAHACKHEIAVARDMGFFELELRNMGVKL